MERRPAPKILNPLDQSKPFDKNFLGKQSPQEPASSTPQPHHDLNSLLTKNCQLTAQLLLILEKERIALEKNDPDAIYTTTEEKRSLVSDLETQRKELPKNRQEMEYWIGQQSGENQKNLNKLWTQLCEQLRQCETLNAINGRIVTVSHNNVTRTLSVLSGNQNHGETYDAQGKTNPNNGPRLEAEV